MGRLMPFQGSVVLSAARRMGVGRYYLIGFIGNIGCLLEVRIADDRGPAGVSLADVFCGADRQGRQNDVVREKWPEYKDRGEVAPRLAVRWVTFAEERNAMKLSYVLPDPGSYTSWQEFEGDVACMKELGYDCVELQIADPADLDEEKLRGMLNKFEYDLVSFQTGSTYYSRGNCLSVPDAGVRERTIELLKRFVDFAQRFSSIIVFGSLQGRASDEADHDKGLGRILAAVKEVGKYATERGVVVAYEPVNHLETEYSNTIAAVAKHIREMALPGVQLMIDTFHMNIEEASMTDCLDGIRDVLKHVHLSETNRDVLGAGHWNTAEFFEKLDEIGYEGCCSIGVYRTQVPRRQAMQECIDVVKRYM